MNEQRTKCNGPTKLPRTEHQVNKTLDTVEILKTLMEEDN